MEDLPLGRIAALVPEFAVKDLHLGRTLMMMINKVTSQKLRNIWIEVEYRLNIPLATNGSHVEVHGT